MLPELSASDNLATSVSSALDELVELDELVDDEASSACKSVFSLATSVFAAELFPEARSLSRETISLLRLLSVDWLSWAVKSVLSLARSAFAPEVSPDARALSSATISCVSLSNELLELLAVDVELSVVALVDAVLVVLAVEVSAAASVLSRSDADEIAEMDKLASFEI